MIKIKDYVKAMSKYSDYEYGEDVKRIVDVLAKKNIEITLEEAEYLWSKHSDEYCAQWLILPREDKQLFEIVIEVAQWLWGEDDE